MTNWKITTRIWGILALTVLMGASCSGFLFYRMQVVVGSYEKLFDQDVHAQDLSRVMQLTFKKQVQEWKDLLLRGRDPESSKKYSAAFSKESDNVRTQAADLRSFLSDEDTRQLLAQFTAAHQTMGVGYARALQAFMASSGADQSGTDAMVKGQDRAPTDIIDRLVAAIGSHSQEHRAAITNSMWAFGLGALIGFALLGITAVHIVRGISHTLRLSVRELSESAEDVARASIQVSTVSQALAQGATEQAASLQETSAAGVESAASTRRNAESSSTAAQLVARLDTKFIETVRSLDSMALSIDRIAGSGDKIASIVRTIDQIAFQTNILALNAAVEAARAGEAGQGFAVVADEVRTLSQRSAQAARSTAELIEESIALSREGNENARSVVEVVRSMTQDTAQVRKIVEQVSFDSQEQLRGMDQISRSLREIDSVTQHAAASAEESASSGRDLSSHAEILRSNVHRLRLMVDGSEVI